MTADMMMRVKDQVLIVLADYQSCKLDTEVFLDQDIARFSAEIARRVMSNYAILTGRKNNLPFMTLAQAAIEVHVAERARLKRDPWALCRDEGTRIRAAYDIARLIEARE